MSKAAIGARVMFCGHNGWFVADIFNFNGINVLHAAEINIPIKYETLTKGRNEEATHTVVDFPKAGFWKPHIGVLVVPAEQCEEIKPKRAKKKNAKRVIQNKAG